MKNQKGFVWIPVLLVIIVVLGVSGGIYFYKHPQKSPHIDGFPNTAKNTTQTLSSSGTQLAQTLVRGDKDLPMVTYMETVGSGDISHKEEVTKAAFGAGVVVGLTGNEKIPTNVKNAQAKGGGVILRMTYVGQWFIDYAIDYPTYPKVLSSYPGGILYLYCADFHNQIGEQVVLAGHQCNPGEEGLISSDGKDIALRNWAAN